MGNTVSRSHIRDAERGVARTTRENTRRNAVPLPLPQQPPSFSSTSTELHSDFTPHHAPRSISFPDHSAPPVCSPHDAHRLRLHPGASSSLPAPAAKRRARHVSADIPFVSPVPHPVSPSARSNSAQDSLLAIAPAHPSLLDPSLPATTFRECHAARTQSPIRVDKPPRARKVVSFNENVHVVTYPCDNSSGYSSGGEQPREEAYPDKARKKRGRSVFRLLHKVAGIEPEPSGCFSGQYDACCGLLNSATDNACQDYSAQHQVIQTRMLDYESQKDQPQFTENDRLSYKTRNRKSAKPPPDTYSRAKGDPVTDDYDYTERHDSLTEPSNLSQPHILFHEGRIPAPVNRSNSSFDISPLWQRLKHVDELDDIDNSRRPVSRNDDIEEDEVRPAPQSSKYLKRSHELKPSSISHSRRSRPLPNPSRSNSAATSVVPPPDPQRMRRIDVGLDDATMTDDARIPTFENGLRESLPHPELNSPSDMRKRRSFDPSVNNVDKPSPVPFPRSASASKPPLPRSKSSACDSEPSFVALQTVNHKSTSLPASSARPGILVQIRGSDRVPTAAQKPDQKYVPVLSNDDLLSVKKPPLPNRKTSQLAEEKKTFMQAIANAENVLQMPTDEQTHASVVPLTQPRARNRDLLEKGSQTGSHVSKRIRSEEARHDMEIKPDSFGTLSSPLTPDSKTEKSFSFKSFPSVPKDNADSQRHHVQPDLQAPEIFSGRASTAFECSNLPEPYSPKVCDEPTLRSSKAARTGTNRISNENGIHEEVESYGHESQGHEVHDAERQRCQMMSTFVDLQTTNVAEREIPQVGNSVAMNSEDHGPDSIFAISSDNEDSAPSLENVVPTVVDPNAAEPVALSSRDFRRHSKRISAQAHYNFAENESLTFAVLNKKDHLINEPRSKPSLPRARSATASHSDDGKPEGVDIFEAANRAAVDINALVEQSKENDSAVGSLDGLDLEPVVLPGDDDYSVAPMSPMQNYTPVAGIYYGNSSPSEEAMSPIDSGSDKIGIPEYPEYEVLRDTENDNEDSVFGSEPNTPVPKEKSGWRDAQPVRSRDLSEQVRDSVAVQLASLSSVHGDRGTGDRTTGKMVPEVLLRDWSGNTPIEPTVEVVDSAPNSRSSESYIFRKDRFPPGVQRSDIKFSRTASQPSNEVRDRLQDAKDRLLRLSRHNVIEERLMHNQRHLDHNYGQFSKSKSVYQNYGGLVTEEEGSTVRNEHTATAQIGVGRSVAFERRHHLRGNGRSRTFEPALPKGFAVDPVLQDFQVPVTRKSLSEAGGQGRRLDASTPFVDEESYVEDARGIRKADLSFKPSNNDARPIHLPLNRRQVSDVDLTSGATRDENQALRGVVGRLVNRMQSAKRMLSTS